ncbi:MAG: bifunctional methylenetetrahydrofolate dehydrogenase/methenyltetrahydrofolate cyclohydrolase FolD [Deltaproteobacteria bacterium]|nr:bifunctional methylenetetrahydrofolate dehydrogenase/methenyltetrahydrofolate cyclohydrolase FolD [Deltaproteobacteria bacterium]
MATILSGEHFAAGIRRRVAERVERLRDAGIAPTLAVVLVGDDPASRIYVRRKHAACHDVGIASRIVALPAACAEERLVETIAALNADPYVHGILVQLPLPQRMNAQRIMAGVAPAKDVDGFHPEDVGRLLLGLPGPRPCTPLGIMRLIEGADVACAGKHAVVVGRSAIVGKPMAMLLTNADATVTLCHSKTADLAAMVQSAEILVAAIGRPAAIRGAWIRPGAVVIDVGMNRLPNGQLAGDVEFAAAHERAAMITPVPGGVGPMTIAMLLSNTLDCCEAAR